MAKDPLSKAVQQTFEATSGAATETRERAASLLDQLVGQGQEAARAVEQRGTRIAGKVTDTVGDAIGEIQKRLRS